MSLLAYDISFNTDARRHGFSTRTDERLHRKIARHLRGINPYIAFLKSTSDRLANDTTIRGYKLLHENPRHHDPRTWGYPVSEEVAAVWEGDPENPLDMPEARDILIEARSGERFSVPYWHPANMALRYPMVFPFGEPSWHKDIPNVGIPMGGTLHARRAGNTTQPLRVAGARQKGRTGKGGSTRVTVASFYKYAMLHASVLSHVD